MSKAQISILKEFEIICNDEHCLQISSKDQQNNIRQITLINWQAQDGNINFTINNRTVKVEDDMRVDLLHPEKVTFLIALRKLMHFRLCNGFQLDQSGISSCGTTQHVIVNKKTNTTVALKLIMRMTIINQLIALQLSPLHTSSVCTNFLNLKKKQLVSLSTKTKRFECT